jgi:hypothetical protein
MFWEKLWCERKEEEKVSNECSVVQEAGKDDCYIHEKDKSKQ